MEWDDGDRGRFTWLFWIVQNNHQKELKEQRERIAKLNKLKRCSCTKPVSRRSSIWCVTCEKIANYQLAKSLFQNFPPVKK